MRRALLVAALVLAVCAWAFSTVALATGDWYLACEQDGVRIGGIDCLNQFPGSARTDDAPARSFGFVPLVLAWLAAATLATALLVLLGLGRRDPT